MDKHGHSEKIGLLGGSFNPAHEGHLEISLAALDVLELDQIWWIVSPGNPLKSTSEMADFDDRFASAQKLATDPRIKVSDLEKTLDTIYTVDTLKQLKASKNKDHFVWLMGADNLIQFHKWKDWKKIANTVPFAVFNRPSYSRESLESVAAKTLESARIPIDQGNTLYSLKPPAWIFYELSDNPLSSTIIRNNIK
jgi:nicotinate-nucleotide adenylyltransferase|tara:strand:+ start:321818 stop:322402 length:585 start_codon:yes stop_codon:yes gene_type:complete